jgi:hypothetical protein
MDLPLPKLDYNPATRNHILSQLLGDRIGKGCRERQRQKDIGIKVPGRHFE